jgi:hypothetical protein
MHLQLCMLVLRTNITWANLTNHLQIWAQLNFSGPEI